MIKEMDFVQRWFRKFMCYDGSGISCRASSYSQINRNLIEIKVGAPYQAVKGTNLIWMSGSDTGNLKWHAHITKDRTGVWFEPLTDEAKLINDKAVERHNKMIAEGKGESIS